jgi:hypothetical protein
MLEAAAEASSFNKAAVMEAALVWEGGLSFCSCITL